MPQYETDLRYYIIIQDVSATSDLEPLPLPTSTFMEPKANTIPKLGVKKQRLLLA